MNESGKTSVLEAVAKTNYFQDDADFEFNFSHDFPRKEKQRVQKTEKIPKAITCTYELCETKDRYLLDKIMSDVGKGVFETKNFSVTTKYNSKGRTWDGIDVDKKKFIEFKTSELGISSQTLTDKLLAVNTPANFQALAESYTEEKYVQGFKELQKYFSWVWKWENPIEEYLARVYLDPNLPKFLYYDEYFSLPSRISLEQLKRQNLVESEYKTANALIELADIDIDDLLDSSDFEDYIALLEATQLTISEELFKYWKTNKNLSIAFQIDKREETDQQNNRRIVEHVLDIRVRNKGVSLPLRNRSKGFNWFFSFLVWFKKIQEDEQSNYILLLDEPGLNLHASAQADLLHFLEDLSEEYQIVFTTHSPFMIPSNGLNRTRTILETDKGSIISESLQEKDPNTLFPLQAALGYDIAQNLFVSKKNLLVEGVSDLIVLTALSGILEADGREGLRSDITIVPTGGLEKVATFISLLRGSKLDIACLLDSYNDAKGKAKMEKMIEEKIINKNKIRFFDEFVDGNKQADMEDLFSKSDYLKLFNSAFTDITDIKESDLNDKIERIIIQINKHIGKDRFNHYRPANEMLKLAVDKDFFSDETIDNFEKLFKEINVILK